MLLTEWAKCPVWREDPAVVSETTVEAPGSAAEEKDRPLSCCYVVVGAEGI
jgi:hypothetical protein